MVGIGKLGWTFWALTMVALGWSWVVVHLRFHWLIILAMLLLDAILGLLFIHYGIEGTFRAIEKEQQNERT